MRQISNFLTTQLNFQKLHFNASYHKGQDDIASAFYLPVMGAAAKYDRAVGFFSSTIYVIAWSALRAFVKNGGKIRIICSPALSTQDVQALQDGYSAKADTDIAERLNKDLQGLLTSPILKAPARVLSSLVAIGVLDLKVALISGSGHVHGRLFHDKVGVFSDEYGNAVVFKGSMNETYSGLSNDGNLESIDVYVSWLDERDKDRVVRECNYFEDLWSDTFPGVVVRDFPKLAKDELLKAADVEHWEQMVDQIVQTIDVATAISADKRPGGIRPRPHQIAALDAWRHSDRRGILEHATGSGKTFTALCAVRSALEEGEVPVILVPSDLLLNQWSTQLHEVLSDCQPKVLLIGGGHDDWKRNGLLASWSRPRTLPNARVIVAMIQTASSSEFLNGIQQGSHLFVVADEVHRLGSRVHQRLLGLESGPRLGLSATPIRAGDPDGTAAVLTYFGGIIQPPFTLQDAIAAGTLTPYFYYVHQVQLNDSEHIEWSKITTQISQTFARMKNSRNDDSRLPERFKRLLIQRSRILKGAAAKVQKAVEVIEKHYKAGQKWIVYCDSQEQMQSVRAHLTAKGINTLDYHSSMQGDRETTLRHFDRNSGIITAIKCLDEGVDIPSVTHALILASSQNPREFIQRRGRVLRRFEGKALAYIHDVLVIPRKDSEEEMESTASIIGPELARAVEFGHFAENPSCFTDLERIALTFKVSLPELAQKGYEED